ncbi:MAG: hypothetical protein M1834_000686 [Cirrosporium novae-zelandiae]|nr:MAG: hypothetical protein M1834_000686 [Cirrosporium novae-zelandiae]
MASASIDLPCTPTLTPARAASEEPSRLHRDSMEDLNSTSQRKRPRLDSGERAHRSMSADIPIYSSPSSHTENNDESSRPAQNNTSKEEELQAPPLNRTSSKVTINTKSQPFNHDTETPTTNMMEAQEDVQPQDMIEDKIIEGAEIDVSPQEVNSAISISSSPGMSPEIEVAEVEDMDQDPGETRWRSLGSTIEGKAHIMDRFPFINRGLHPREALARMATVLAKGAYEDQYQVVTELSIWLAACIEECGRPTGLRYHDIVQNRDFWEELIGPFDKLIMKPTVDMQFANFLKRPKGSNNGNVLVDFFAKYAALAIHFVRIDCSTLERLPEDGTGGAPDLLSYNLLQRVDWMLNFTPNNPLYTALSKTGKFDPKAHCAKLVLGLAQSGELNGIGHLTRYLQKLMDHITRFPSTIDCIYSVIIVIWRASIYTDYIRDEWVLPSDNWTSLRHQIYESCLKFWQILDEHLQDLIQKQSPSLSIDFITTLTESVQSIARANSTIARRLTLELGEDLPLMEDELCPEACPDLILYAWKFRLLKLCIMKGRMETRVSGTGVMGDSLVTAWKTHIQMPNHPVMRYCSRFLIENKLVEYLVGVDSHPQLITRSKNIIGFLGVTDSYTEADSDHMWEAVTTNQDQRIVNAVLQLFRDLFQYFKFPLLIYICKKLDELPITLYSDDMLEYVNTLMSKIRETYQTGTILDDASANSSELVPFEVCVRLIREAAANTQLALERRESICSTGTDQLFMFLQLGLLESEKTAIFSKCMQDIADQTPNATGSIIAINVFLRQNNCVDIQPLSSDFKLPELIINEFPTAFRRLEESRSSIRLSEILDPRIWLLEHIIISVPQAITKDLLDKLWRSVFSRGDLPAEARNTAWNMLSRIASNGRSENVFINTFLEQYLPRVNPEFYTPEVLSFVHASVQYDIRQCTRPTAAEHEIIQIPGIDRIWQILLSAPTESLEISTSKLLISMYLDSDPIRYAPTTAIEATHLDLVDRCVKLLTSAAAKLKSFTDGILSGEDEPMVIVATDAEIQKEELKFIRSLLFLREFLQGMRTRPMYSPPMGTRSPIDLANLRGNVMNIKYQVFNGAEQTGIKTLQVGDMNTGGELAEMLIAITGFSRFSVIVGGGRIDLSAVKSETLKELNIGQQGLLIVRKAPGAEEIHKPNLQQSVSSVDAEVLQHFDKLYNLLDLDEKLASKIYDLLVQFLPQKQIYELIESENVSPEVVFPPRQAYKILYSLRTLNACLKEHLKTNPNDQNFVSHGIRLLSATLVQDEVCSTVSDSAFKLSVAQQLVASLLFFLRERDREGRSLSDVVNGKTLGTLRSLIDAGQSTVAISTVESPYLVCQSFECIIELCIQSPTIWKLFQQESDLTKILKSLLLDEQRSNIRRGIAAVTASICCRLEIKSGAGFDDFLFTFWQSMLSIIPETTHHFDSSAETLEIAHVVFSAIGDRFQDNLPLQDYFSQWSSLLLSYNHHESVGMERVDHIVLGLANLLGGCIDLAKLRKYQLQDGNLTEKLFFRFMFPALSEDKGSLEQRLEPKVPILSSPTRSEIYSILLDLSSKNGESERLLNLVKDLVLQGAFDPHWPWYIASTQRKKGYTMEPSFNFDRSKSIRSSAGYAGLRNLSNTCYLNSLFTQLYMNLDFRKFMLEINIPDPSGSQKLLNAIQKVFGFMQDTWLKCVDPESIATSIKTYDNEPIDVANQMDVDEFYNLLFDRLESQILSDRDKNQFRSFYGGHLVQQIKSQECAHISERVEPFSAIQCDIKGKGSLEESLRAYVEGEIMQGDNKYKCEACNRFVNAVKRACMKEIPDNMIFHLKRFDFDMNTMQRSKINDTFRFPTEIDLAPYHISGINDPHPEREPDMFELVGVLVHSGTAESGHYYSYIRERPNTQTGDARWVEYNDADVTRFDSATIPDQCFGGWGETFPGGPCPVRMQKAWNAYMLFYQRVSSLAKTEEDFVPQEVGKPARVLPSVQLSNQIAMENERFIRQYCLFDPSYPHFIKNLIENVRGQYQGGCSNDHRIEYETTQIALQVVELVVARSKDLPEFDGLMAMLDKYNKNCMQCNKLAIDWIVSQQQFSRNLLMRNPQAHVRETFCRLLVMALRYGHESESPLYGLEPSQLQDPGYDDHVPNGTFHSITSSLLKLSAFLSVHQRCWDDYFAMFGALANIGTVEAYALIKMGLLQTILELLIVHDASGLSDFKYKYQNYIRAVNERGKRFSYSKLLTLLRVLLSKVDLSGTCSHTENRSLDDEYFPLSDDEEQLLRLQSPGNKDILIWFDRALQVQQNMPAVCEIFEMLLRPEPEFGLYPSAFTTICNGLMSDPANLAAPYLQVSLVICEYHKVVDDIENLFEKIAKGVETLEGHGGREHLEFFERLVGIRNKTAAAVEISFTDLVTRKSPKWAPPLLVYWDQNVRDGTIALLQKLLTNFHSDTDDDDDRAQQTAVTGRELAKAYLRKVKSLYMNPQGQQPVASAVATIQEILKFCIERYFDPDHTEQQHFIHIAKNVMQDLSYRAVDEIADDVSDEWDDNSAFASESELDPLQMPSE